MKVIIAGDFCDKERISDMLIKGDYKSLFDNIKPIVEEHDCSFVNFEFPIVLKEGNPIPKCGPNLKGHPNSVAAIKYAGFSCATLANNHILDQGERCCLDTKHLLEDANIATVGVGNNLEDAGEILYLDKADKTLAVINCCEHEFTIATNKSAGANPLNPIRQYSKIQEAKNKADYVIVIVHGGHEHFQLPSPRMKETYRFFVEVGADAVINHHQHCYSGYEYYKGKPIVYGLGNFLFDWEGKRNGIWNEGYMASITFNPNQDPILDIIPYTQCNEEPSVKLMNVDERNTFNKHINYLNEIINDEIQLESKFSEYASSRARDVLSIFAPWMSRISKGLCARGFLPLLLNLRRTRILRNYLICEAHRDITCFNVNDLWARLNSK